MTSVPNTRERAHFPKRALSLTISLIPIEYQQFTDDWTILMITIQKLFFRYWFGGKPTIFLNDVLK